MRIIFFSASNFGLACLKVISKIEEIQIVGIVTTLNDIIITNGKRMENIHHVLFDEEADKYGIPILHISGSMEQKEYIQWMEEKKMDFGLAIGWYKKIPKVILDIPKKGLAGIHGSLLPQYRGGAPLVWAMIQGEKMTGVSLFYFTEGIDEGDIIAQRSFEIKYSDYISDIYKRMEWHAIEILKTELPNISNNTINTWKQPVSEPIKVWPMRSPEDGIINWEQSAEQIYNFIRAQSRPYPGAYTYMNHTKVHIWKSKVIESIGNNELNHCKCGDMIKCETGFGFLAVTGSGILKVEDYTIDELRVNETN